MKSEAVTLVLVNLAGIMKQADESLLPGVYKEVGKALHTDPTGLGSLTLFRSLVESSCYPLAAYLSLRYNRAHIIALGAFLWAAATFLVAISSTFLQVAISRGLNGIGLAIVTPAIQSLVADSTNETNRGMAFGWLQLTGNLGSIIGGLSSVLIASTSFAGIPGWRLSFHLVALISVLVGTLVYLFANDPLYSDTRNEKTPQQKPTTSFCSEMRNLMKQAKSVVGIPTFQIIVVQGVPGSFPGFALSFAPLWLELSGFSHVTTGLLWTLFVLALSFGSLFGGWLGDKFAKRLPSCGRIVLAQISAGSMIPLAAILLLGLRADPSTTFLHGLVLIVMGLTTSWCAPATNNPIFAEIVPEKSRTCIYALDRFFETMLASFAPPVVGILAQHVYGYKPIPKGSSNTQEIETDRENAASLAKALYTAICIPRAMCVFLYSFLYCTYTRDKDRARMASMVESEMQKLKVEEEEEGVRELSEECCKFHDSESNGVNAEEGIMFDIDDSDEKSLLSSGLAR